MKPKFTNIFLAVAVAPTALVITASNIQAQSFYRSLTDSWATGANWSGGVAPSGAFNQRININGGTSVTFAAAQGTVDIGTASARAFTVGLINGQAAPDNTTGTATLNITGGILRANSTTSAASLVGVNATGSTGILNVSGTGILDLTTGTGSGQILALGLASGTNSGISGTVNLSGSGLIKVGSFRIAETNATTGGITGILNLDGGTLETGSLMEGTGSAISNAISTVNLNGGMLRLTGATGISASLNNVNVLSGANIEVVTGVIAASGKDLIAVGVGGLTKTGDGTLTLTNASTYTGATAISAGALSAGKVDVSGGNSSLGNATSAVTLGSAGSQGTLSYTGNTATYTRGFTIGGAGGGRLDVTSSGQTLSVDTGAITGSGLFTIGGSGQKIINAAITHTGGLTKTASSGSITLSNSTNSYTGVTDITGALIVTANNALGSTAGGTTVNANSTLGLSGGIDYAATETVSGSGVGTGAIAGITAATQRGFIQSVSGNNTFRGNIIVNAGGVSRIGSQNGASLTLTGTITQSAGTMLFRPGDLAGDFVTLANSGNSFAGNSTIYTNLAAGGYAGVRLGVTNALPTALTVLGEASTGAATALDLNGFNQTLNGLAGATILNIINSNTSTASTLTVDNLLDRTSSGTVIRGDVGLGIINVVKDGAFTQTLSGTHDYTGTTAVNNGKLLINGNISTSTLTAVASGATIGGSGTTGALTVQSGGFVTPGNSPGILTVSGNYIQAGTYTAEINGLTPGNLASNHDQIIVTGTVDITGGSLTSLFTGTYAVNDMIFILLNDGVDAITGTYSGLAQGAVFTSGGYDWQISYIANSGGSPSFTGGNDIALMAIPEPSAALLGGLGLLALMRRRR